MSVLYLIMLFSVQRKALQLIGFLLGFMYTNTAFAHVKWFVETEEIVAKETMFFRLDDPFVLLWIAVIVLTLVAAFLLDIVLPDPSKKFLKRVEGWRPSVFRIFEIVIGLNLLIEAYLGAVIAPPFVAFNHFTFVLLGLQIFVGFLLLIGLNVQQGAMALLVLYFASMLQFGFMPVLDEIFMIGVCAYLFFGAREKKEWFPEYEVYAIPLLRVFTGISLVILAFSEKFFHPELGLNFLGKYQWNFMQMIGIEDFSNMMFVFSAGAMELLFGIIMILGFVPRINMAAAALFFSITFFLLGPVELIGHMPIFVTAMVVVLYGGGEKLNVKNLLPHKKRNGIAALFGR